MSEERLIDLESKISHLEMLIAELNLVITNQQSTIDYLDKAVRIMANTSTDSSRKPAPVNLVPPHY